LVRTGYVDPVNTNIENVLNPVPVVNDDAPNNEEEGDN